MNRPMMATVRRLQRGWRLAVIGLGCPALAVIILWPHDASPDPSVARSATSAVQIREVTDDELALLHRAEQLIIRDCMARHGFRYWPAPWLPAPGFRSFPYVIDDLTWAKNHGYGRDIQRWMEDQSKTGPTARYQGALSKDRLNALGATLHGPRPEGLAVESPLGGTVSHSDKGCTSSAWRQLYGDIKEWYRSSQSVMHLNTIRISRVAQEAAFRQATNIWSRCMSKKGISAPDPLTLRDRRLADYGADAEIEDQHTAQAEARCAQKSGLARTARDLDRHHAHKIHVEYKTAYDTTWRLQLTALPMARSIAAKA